MEPTEASKHRKREYVVIKYGRSYYYARASRQNPDMYVIMIACTNAEAQEIVDKANAQSDMNNAIDALIETGAKFQKNWAPATEEEEVGPNGRNEPI